MPRKKLVIDEKHVMSLKVAGLKKLCAKYKLAKTGRKAALQDRILEHLQLGKYAVVAEAEPTEESELETASTAQSEPQEEKVGEQSQESAITLPGESSSKVERKVDSSEGLDTVTDEIVENTENKTTGIKRTSSEATISNDDSIAEKKRKVANTLETEEIEETSAEADSTEVPESTGVESQAEQEMGDSELSVSSSTKVTGEIETIDSESQERADDKEEAAQQKNVEKTLVEPLSNVPVTTAKKTEEIVSKALKPKEDVDEKVSTISTASVSIKQIVDAVSEVVESKEPDEIIPKDVEAKKKIPVSPQLKKQKKILPSKKPAFSSQKEEKESKRTNDEDDAKPSKSNQWKKKWKGRNSKSNRGYQQRDIQKRRGQNRNWGQNKANRNNRDRNSSRNRGWQSGNRQSQPSWLYPQQNWRSSSSPQMPNQRGWNSGGGWQQRSYYIGGYGQDRSGRGRGWGKQNNGRWGNRRNVWRDNKRGRGGRR